MSEVLLRPAETRELDRLSELWLALLAHHAEAGARFAPAAEASAQCRSELSRRLSQADTFFHVAALPGSGSGPAPLAGFCLGRILRRPPLFRETQRGEIESLFVADSFRRRGVGTLLVEGALAWMRQQGVSRVELAVDTRNPSGRAFWERLGFVQTMEIRERKL